MWNNNEAIIIQQITKNKENIKNSKIYKAFK